MNKITLLIKSCYLTKMEVMIISVLCITSYYSVKMEMRLAETNALNVSTTLVENRLMQSHSSDNVIQPILVLKKNIHQAPHSLRFKVELALSYFMNKNYAQAKFLAEQVLAEKDLSEAVHSNIQDFITHIEVDYLHDKTEMNIAQHANRIFHHYDNNERMMTEDNRAELESLQRPQWSALTN